METSRVHDGDPTTRLPALVPRSAHLDDGIRRGRSRIADPGVRRDRVRVSDLSGDRTRSRPYLVFGLLAGAMADRMPRRRTMVLADLAGSLSLATIVIAWLADTRTGIHVLVVAGLVGTASCGSNAASWGAMPRLVGRDRLAEANGIVWSSVIALGIVVPSLTGLVLSVTRPVVVLGVDAVSFVVSALMIMVIRKPLGPHRIRTDVPGTAVQTVRTDVTEGLRFVWGHMVLRILTFAGFGLSLSGGAVVSLLVVHARAELAIAPDSRTIGLLFTAGAAGAMAASRLLGRLSRRFGPARSRRGRTCSTSPS